MSLRLQIRKKLLVHSSRVKCVQFHPQNPWILTGLYSGALSIHDYTTQSCIKTIEASQLPVRAACFIAKKQWVLAGTDDFKVRVFNYNTLEKVKEFEAHSDFVRAIVVHPQESYIITCSDDASIKVWDYEKGFSVFRTMKDHNHFVMDVAINPRDPSKFASASMDKTVKVWNITSESKANFTLTGHTGGVNAVNFYNGDKPFIVSGSDDKTVRVWDYQTKQVISTLDGHSSTVTAVMFHFELPILFSTSQGGKVLVHNSNNFYLENTLEYELQRAWAIDISKENSSMICFGFDEGTVAVKIGSDEPVVSMSQGKLLWTKAMEVISANLKAVNVEELTEERVSLPTKDLGTCEMFPTIIRHNSNGHLFAICNDLEFSIMRTAVFKNIKYGTGTDLVWGAQGDFAVREGKTVKVFKNNEQVFQFVKDDVITNLYGGAVLSVVTQRGISVHSWETYKQLSSLPLCPKKLYWNESSTLAALLFPEKYVICALKSNGQLRELYTIMDRINSGIFIANIFFYITLSGKLNYSINGKSFFFLNSDKRRFIIGSIEQHNRIYCFDKNYHVYGHQVPFELITLLSSIAEGKVKSINPENVLPEYRDRVAKFLDAFDLKEQAFEMVENKDHKFELAVNLGRIEEAFDIASTEKGSDKFKVIGDLALANGSIELAIKCFDKINDVNGLLLIYSTLSLPKQLKQLGEKAEKLCKMNVAFQCYFITNQPEKCFNVLVKSKRFSQAALFARTYIPEKISEAVSLWKKSLDNKTVANKIYDPTGDEEEEQEGEGEVEEGEEGEEEGEGEQQETET